MPTDDWYIAEAQNWDWNDDPRTKGLQTNLVRLTSERDEAVREKEKLFGAIERLTNLIDGHDWLADGRGPMDCGRGRYCGQDVQSGQMP